MSLIIKEGNYLTLGTKVSKNQMVFTFEAEKEDDCRIILIHKLTGEKEYLSVSETYCRGSLRSIAVSGINFQEYNYLYEINGKEQIDPYATAIIGREIWNDSSRKENKYKITGSFATTSYRWGKDKNPEIPKADMIMYKLHVRSFTMGLKRSEKNKGTFQALRKKIPYLKDLGITTLELMPVYEFEEMPIPEEVQVPDYVKWEAEENDKIQPMVFEKQEKKLNMWGYAEGNYFAVKSSYASVPEKASVEFKKLVKTLHENNMECVMEVFFPETISHVFIMDVLHFWAREYHVDGFHLLGKSLPIGSVVHDPLLSRTKIFADTFYEEYDKNRKYKNLFIYKEEYQFPARMLLNHYDTDIQQFANQQKKQNENYGFVNFITSNNGFTMADLFSYNEKHNEENGENNKDGSDYNLSYNYGIEGVSKKRFVNDMRRRKMRLAFTMLMYAQGVPLIMAGDEFGNSQMGNNNAYCQDNEIGWVNWSLFSKYKSEREYLKNLIAFRKTHKLIAREIPFRFTDYHSVGIPDMSYHGENAWISQIDHGRKSLGVLYCGAYAKVGQSDEDIYIAYNFTAEETSLALPSLANKTWTLNGSALDDAMFVKVPADTILVLISVPKELPLEITETTEPTSIKTSDDRTKQTEKIEKNEKIEKIEKIEKTRRKP